MNGKPWLVTTGISTSDRSFLIVAVAVVVAEVVVETAALLPSLLSQTAKGKLRQKH